MEATTKRVSFKGSHGAELSARLDLPFGNVRAFAIFAHCFTCSKDFHATRHISSQLARLGIAVLRFDFTGLGSSDGDFASTNFSSNVEDLRIAADYLRSNHQAPQLLIGHSLGGAAVLSVAGDIPEVKAVATIGAPSDAKHVVHNFGDNISKIENDGETEVSLGGRTFSIRKQFLDDLKNSMVLEHTRKMKIPLLVMHSPIDQVVGVENAQDIFVAAKHPKSFVSLDNADHMLSEKLDAKFAADVIAAWSERYLDAPIEEADVDEHTGIEISETGIGKFQNLVLAGKHRLMADEPASVGGLDTGPSPYDYMSIALGACTSMTIRMYAQFKKLDIGKISVTVDHAKVHANDCGDCIDSQKPREGKIDRFERRVSVDGVDDPELQQKLLEIADKCPVHRTLESGASVITRFES